MASDVVHQRAAVARMDTAQKVRFRWRSQARDKQLTPGLHALCTVPREDCVRNVAAAARKFGTSKERADDRDDWLRERGHHPWWIWCLLAGRGWGKTKTGAEDITTYMLNHPGCRVALVAATFQDGRDTMVEGNSGLRAIIPESLVRDWNRSLGELILTNGARAKIYSAEKPERLRGPQHERAWCLLSGTRIATPVGTRRIELLRIGDGIVTPAGVRRVTAVGSRTAALWRLRLVDGREIVGSADHPVATGRGWVRLADITDNDKIQTWCDDGTRGPTDTSSPTRTVTSSTSIEPCTRRPTESRSSRTTTSTTSTRSATITGPRTSDSGPRANTGPITDEKPSTSARHAVIDVRQQVRRALRRLVRDAQRKRQRNVAGHVLVVSARHVDERFSPQVTDHLDLSTTAVAGAATPVGASGTVHNLTVEGEHVYFAEGILTHNCDEMAAWEYLQRTWDMLLFGLRLGPNPQVVITTTPKAYRFIRKIVADSVSPREGVVLTSGKTDENRGNLPSPILRKLHELYAGTRLGRQELDAEVLDELGAGVIRLEDIERARLFPNQVNAAVDFADIAGRELSGMFARVVVAVDPAVTSDPRTSDETGIVVVGRTHKPCPFCSRDQNPHRKAHAVVLADHSGIMSDSVWADRLAALYKRWRADAVVAEVNNGGDLVESVIHAVEPGIPVRKVRASRGKVQRAEPVGACYERGEVHHYQTEGSQPFSVLEDQLTRLGADLEEDEGYREGSGEGTPSPDHADAAVWGISDLMVPVESVTTLGRVVDKRGSRSRKDPTLERMREQLAKDTGASVPGRRPDLSRNGRRRRGR